TYGAGIGVTYDPERLKILWEQKALEYGVRLLFHTFVVDVLQEGNRVTGIIAAGKNGLIKLRADAIIDASGDADLAAAAGAPFDGVKAGEVQAMTTTFRLVNVDMDTAQNVPNETLRHLLQEAVETGDYTLPRREGSVHVTPIEGVVATNLVRVSEVDGTDPEQLTRAEIEGRRQALEYVRFLRDSVPGYGHAELVSLSTQIGIRESRRIRGRYRLTREDVLSASRFDDVIGRCGAPIEVHRNGGQTRWEYLPAGMAYDIPYRCLLPREIDGLLVAGRCLSADHDAHASVRNMAQCMAMGQAAGIAAALAVQHKIVPGDVEVPELQEAIRSLGGIL
ncbi:MAG TPA: FAD-dependent oxidoreductase, partial [Gammaproteobacteria bacterium]|nr:FAD-dependent oxidoreductase [Gammaproteobacteria bacterium]